VSLVARVDSRTQESLRGHNDLSWFGAIDALCPVADNLYTQEHQKSRGLQQSVQGKEKDLVWDRSMLILRLPRHWCSLSLAEEEDDVSGGGALGAPL
jgi:hypothetical protein